MSEQLSAGQRSKIRRLSQPRELAPDEEGGELNIVPFLDIIVNILIFVLATVAVTFTATLETNPPTAGGGGIAAKRDKEALNLTVFVTGQGFSIKASGGNIAPGCSGQGPGIAIPMKGTEYDFVTLRDCAKKLKGASDAFAEERQVSIASNPDINYQVIVSTMDALRADDQDNEMFPDVTFSMQAGKK